MANVDMVLRQRAENEIATRRFDVKSAFSTAWNTAADTLEKQKDSPVLREKIIEIFMGAGVSLNTARDLLRDLIHGQRPVAA